MEEAEGDQQRHHLRENDPKKMFLNNCFQGNCRADHLEEGAYGLDVLVGEDDHTKESGESTVEDVRSGPVD